MGVRLLALSIVSLQVLPKGYPEYKDTVLLPTKVSTQSCATEKENSERTLTVIRHSPLVVKLQDLKERVLELGTQCVMQRLAAVDLPGTC